MNCNHVQNLISAFIDDELSAEEKRELRSHLFFCSECHSEYQNLLKIKGCLNNLNQEQCNYDPVVAFRLRIADAEHSFFQETNRFFMLGRLGLVTGCVTLFFFSTVALFPNSSSRSQLSKATPSQGELVPSTKSTVNRVEALNTFEAAIDSVDQDFSLDQPVTVYQASSILP